MAPLSAETIARSVLDALKQRTAGSPGRVFLLAGPWGAGKTYLWNEKIRPGLEQAIYVSAFGAENASQLKSRILTQNLLALTPSKAKGLFGWLPDGGTVEGTLRDLSSVVDKLGFAAHSRFGLDPLVAINWLKPNAVLCIDDVERISSSFQIEDFLGVANVLSEHKGIDVILISNEDKIGSGDQEKAETYFRHKEKVVHREFHIEADVRALFDAFVRRIVPTESSLNRNVLREEVLRIFERSASQNLRDLNRTISAAEQCSASGVELSREQVRLLAALTIDRSMGTEKRGAEFYNFNEIVVRLGNRLSKKQAPDPKNEKRQAFVEKYFGEADYVFHPGIFEMVERGVLNRELFIRPETELTPFQKWMVDLKSQEWRYASDQGLGSALQAGCELIAKEPTSARDVLECLAYLRMLGELIGRTVPTEVQVRVVSHLKARATGGDDSVTADWLMYMNELKSYIKDEVGAYQQQLATAKIDDAKERFKALLASEDQTALAQYVASDPENARLFLDGVGWKPLVEVRNSRPKTFTLVCQLLIEMLAKYRGIVAGPDAFAELRGLLKEVAQNPNEERMTVWRANGILKQIPAPS